MSRLASDLLLKNQPVRAWRASPAAATRMYADTWVRSDFPAIFPGLNLIQQLMATPWLGDESVGAGRYRQSSSASRPVLVALTAIWAASRS